MTQPTQEDLELIFTKILKENIREKDSIKWACNPASHVERPLGTWNPYTDDSFSGALVKAVFPLLAEKNWSIEIYKDRIEIRSYAQYDGYYTQITAPNLNTALIEAWKIHNQA